MKLFVIILYITYQYSIFLYSLQNQLLKFLFTASEDVPVDLAPYAGNRMRIGMLPDLPVQLGAPAVIGDPKRVVFCLEVSVQVCFVKIRRAVYDRIGSVIAFDFVAKGFRLSDHFFRIGHETVRFDVEHRKEVPLL